MTKYKPQIPQINIYKPTVILSHPDMSSCKINNIQSTLLVCPMLITEEKDKIIFVCV